MSSLFDLPSELIFEIVGHVGPTACLLNFVQKEYRFPLCNIRDVVDEACRHDNPELLKFVFDHKTILTKNIDRLAAQHGAIQCLQFIKECGLLSPGWSYATASGHGQLAVMKWIRENNYMHEIYANDALNAAASGGHFDCIQWLMQHSYFYGYDSFIYTLAVEKGHFDCIKKLYDAGYEWNEEVTRAAAEFGQARCLEWLYENGCPWDSRIWTESAVIGDLDCLKIAYKYCCPWDQNAYLLTIEEGHHECFKWMYEKGLPWNDAYVSTDYREMYHEYIANLNAN